MTAPSSGFVSKLGFGSASPVTERYAFKTCGLARDSKHVSGDDYIRGVRGRLSAPVQQDTYAVGGPVVMQCTPLVMEHMLPRILGSTGAAGTTGTKYILADSLPSFYGTVDKIAHVATYAGLVVNKATFRGSKGNQIVEVELDLQGQTESIGSAGSFPNINITSEQPFMFYQSTVTLNGIGNRNFDNWELVIDNKLDLEYYFNSQTRIALPPQDREITFKCDVPFRTDETDLYNQPVAGAAGTILFTNGSAGLQFNMSALQVPAKSPIIEGKKVVILKLEGMVRGTNGSDELVVEST